MIKYAISITGFEFNPSKYHTIEDAFFNADGTSDARRIAVYDNVDEARENLLKIAVSTTLFNRELARVDTMAYIEEADFEWDDDLEAWEVIMGSNYTDMRYEDLPQPDDDNDEN